MAAESILNLATCPSALSLTTQPHVPTIGEPPATGDNHYYIRDFGVNHITDQLQYVQSLDLVNESQEDAGDRTWNPLFIYGHRISKRHGKRDLKVKVGWLTESPTWTTLEAVKLQQPFVVIDYVNRHSLLRHPDFSWVSEYTKRPRTVAHMAKAFAAKAHGNTPRYKFGVHVPRSITHAFKLDQENGDNLWQEAMNKELKQINEFKTFRTLGKGEDLKEFTRIPYHMVFDVKFDL